jgi:hypothetical protein
MSRASTNKPGGTGRPGQKRGLAAFFLPDEPRDFPARRWVKMALRAAHVLTTGILCGAYLFEASGAQRTPWLIGATLSGLLILLLDLYESGAFLLQVRGLVVLAKVGVLAALPVFGPGAGWILACLVLVSVVSSHASSKVRYFVVLGGGGIKGARSKG